ncbi:hypothetical protein LTR78_002303 [Recurvomyces mirabilis]|uniref:WD40 repeat-like protein n=1 Tax=Recurvomyces mirabilis TaxID=574656 RepID=A0AAE0WUT0_9PEZI|nr:hypothetical protein LTR78_002303 [Recurvomyces mirabilis]KAK5160758.1 hypothetical protein LTS14_001771 [Recurvomyces mirabilis]
MFLTPACVANTGDTFDTTHEVNREDTTTGGVGETTRNNYFREVQFSPDGTSIVTLNNDQTLRTFILPPDLLDDGEKPRQLQEYAAFRSPASIHSYAIHPAYALQDPSTTLVLHAATDQPLSLRNSLDYSTIAAKYNNTCPTTEAHLSSYSLAFTKDGGHFISGGNNQLSLFDCYQGYSDAITTHRLAPGRKARKLFGDQPLGCKGIVSALAISDEGMLAAGTTEREIGLFPDEGRSGCLVSFSLANKAILPEDEPVLQGTGITHLKWSPDSNYLVIAERQSDCIHVYDIRNTIRRVSWLSGRKAKTTQRLGFDVMPTSDGFEVWAGGNDGAVRMWKDAGKVEGEQVPDAEMKMHGDAVASTVWHPNGAVLATCSGQRRQGSNLRYDSDVEAETASSTTNLDRMQRDNSLAIWTVASTT